MKMVASQQTKAMLQKALGTGILSSTETVTGPEVALPKGLDGLGMMGDE